MEDATKKQADTPKSMVDVPPVVMTTVTLIFIYVSLLLLNTVIYAFRTGKWGAIFGGVWWFLTGLMVGGNLINRNKWTWWATLIGCIVFSGMSVISLLAAFVRIQRHLPQEPQFLVAALLGIGFLLPIAIRLLRRDTRVAFGISKPDPADTVAAERSESPVP